MKRRSLVLSQPAAPILLDTDPETSIDLDKSVGKLQEPKKTNLTKSIFEITLKDLESPKKKDEFNAYEARLRQEIKDWTKYITKALADLKVAKQKHPTVDCTILSKERREYISKAPDLDRFLRRIREFRRLAAKFVENDYAEILCLKQNLAEAYTMSHTLIKENFLAERLANEENMYNSF